MENQSKSLNQTFVPKTILRKTQMKNTNPLVQKNNFDKTHGNIYVQLDPPQIKFNGYQVNKINTLSFKIINKAPIPQRFNIIPPTQAHFTIKVNKKGNIPTGMYETVQVSFKATDYKYLYDVVKINTETQNFIVPLYAYPTIPNIRSILPKNIDFGYIELKQTQSFLYPVKNPTPIDYRFDFLYKKQCSEIMINPLSGTIPGNGQTIVQISFIPNKKMTYSAQVYFQMKQFDFQPIYIQIVGSGKQGQKTTIKRLKSSKLVPLKQKQDGQEKQRMNQTQIFLNDRMKDTKKSFQTNIRKVNPRISYPKLLNSNLKQKNMKAQQTLVSQLNDKSAGSAVFKNSEQRQFMNRFNRVQQMDKEKQIKFSQFLGDRAMNQEQIQFQRSIVSEMKDFRNNLAKNQCQTRYNPEKSQTPEVEYKIVRDKQISWDQNKNDLIYERKAILNKFVIAASKIIQVRRIKKRFAKINQFLSDCSNKQEVAKKVEVSYQKSLDSHSQNAFIGEIGLSFNRNFIEPTYFPLQFIEGKQKFSDKIFKPEGKPEFDDLKTLDLIQPYESEKMTYNQISYPADFIHLDKLVPFQRVSGQEQFSVKSTSLPQVDPSVLFGIVSKPFDIPNHYFIHQKQNVSLFKEYDSIDEKDPRNLFSIEQPLEDQFQGWSKGQFQVLKAKLLKNTGVSYTSFSSYNFSSTRNDVGFLGELTKNMNGFIQKPEIDDQISDGDSDDEKYEEKKLEKVQEFLQKIQANPEIKARRNKKQVQNENIKARDKIQRNIQKDKLKQLTKYIQKTNIMNKVIQRAENLLIL